MHLVPRRPVIRHPLPHPLAVVLLVVLGTLGGPASPADSQSTWNRETATDDRSVAVRFRSGDTALTGLLRLPSGEPPHPAVLLLPGSRPTSREDDRLTAVAEAFVGEGFAVLTVDSRGTGDSGGSFERATFEVLADDAAAAVRTLRDHPDVRADAVGLWGVSQGATWVGPLAAARADVAFLVAASGPLATPEEFMHDFFAGRLRDAHDLDASSIERARKARSALWSYYATGRGRDAARSAIESVRDEPWRATAGLPSSVRPRAELSSLPAPTRTFLAQKDFDPVAALTDLPCPLLAVYGGRDGKLPVEEHVETLRELAGRPGTRIRVEVIPGADHDLHPDPAASDPPRPLERMARWAARRVGHTPAGRTGDPRSHRSPHHEGLQRPRDGHHRRGPGELTPRLSPAPRRPPRRRPGPGGASRGRHAASQALVAMGPAAPVVALPLRLGLRFLAVD